MKELKKFRVQNDLTQPELAEFLGISKQHVCNMENGHCQISPKTLRRLVTNNRGWDTSALQPLVEGKEDELLIGGDPVAASSLVPVIPMDAMAGPLAEYINEGVVAAQCERILSPIAGATCAVRIYGDSMYPKYSSGSVALLREVDASIYIEWGRTYVLDTTNGPVIKMINKGADSTTVSCSSFNPIYEPFEIRKEDVLHWYRVLMVMSFE